MTDHDRVQVLGYGGGVQTVAMCCLILSGVLPRPDRIVMADTGREVASTFAYLDTHVRPALADVGLAVEVAPHKLAAVDLYAKNGDLLMPVFTASGKLPTFCSTEWKQRVAERHLRASGVTSATTWIGISAEEKRRRSPGVPPWLRSYPLTDLMLTRDDCKAIIARRGWPEPRKSRCWMCPHQSNAEWRQLRDESPEEFAQAVAMDTALRDADDRGGVFLHRGLVPLAKADIDAPERPHAERQCGLGLCWI